jgi:hypothetical protein
MTRACRLATPLRKAGTEVALGAVYIDGFNLYFGALRDSPELKWLDVAQLGRRLLPKQHELVSVKFFTARITPRNGDETAPLRQDAYLRAIAANPLVSVFEG